MHIVGFRDCYSVCEGAELGARAAAGRMFQVCKFSSHDPNFNCMGFRALLRKTSKLNKIDNIQFYSFHFPSPLVGSVQGYLHQHMHLKTKYYSIFTICKVLSVTSVSSIQTISLRCFIRINNIANASHFLRFESFFYTLPDQYF